MHESRGSSTIFWQRLVTWSVWGAFALLVGWIVVSVTAGVFG